MASPAPTRPTCPARQLAEQLAAHLPERAGQPWTVQPGRYAAWWTTRPAARLEQAGRALIVAARTWDTELAWQLPGREPYRPDLTMPSIDPARIAREVLRLLLPVVDDEAARTREDVAQARLELLYEIGAAMRAQGAATNERGGVLANTATVTWSASGVRYSATLHGANPVCDVQIRGQARDVEQALAHFLPEAGRGRPSVPDGIRGRLERRMANVLARHGSVEQLDGKGLAFGAGSGPYGYVAPAADPAATAHDSTPASADLHAVGVDFLVSLAPQLAR